MELQNVINYDSVWSSDNQSPIYGFRIFKDSALRLPPCYIEKWDVRRFFDGFPKYAHKEFVTLPISCNGATWDNVLNVKSEYTHGFMTGGPIGFSTDIASYPDTEKLALKKHIEKFKAERDFYKKATMRILHDSDNLTVIEYADDRYNKIQIQIFTNIVNQSVVTIYPVVDKNACYAIDDKMIDGAELSANGIKVGLSDIDCKIIDVIKSIT